MNANAEAQKYLRRIALISVSEGEGTANGRK